MNTTTTHYTVIHQLIYRVYTLADYRKDKILTTSELFSVVEENLNRNSNLKITKFFIKNGYDIRDITFLLLLIWETVAYGEGQRVKYFTDLIFDKYSERKSFQKGLINGSNRLVKENMIATAAGEDFIKGEEVIRFTYYGILQLRNKDVDINSYFSHFYQHLTPDNIRNSDSFFNDREQAISKPDKEKTDSLKNKIEALSGTSKKPLLLCNDAVTEQIPSLVCQFDKPAMIVNFQSPGFPLTVSSGLVQRVFEDYNSLLRKNTKNAPLLVFSSSDFKNDPELKPFLIKIFHSYLQEEMKNNFEIVCL